jgi:hypothetical protein
MSFLAAISAKTKALAGSLHGRLRLFFVHRTRHLEAETIGRIAVADKSNFCTNIGAFMRKCQKTPTKSLLPSKSILQIRLMKMTTLMG